MTNRPSITDLARSMNDNRALAEEMLAEGYAVSASVYAADADVDEALILARMSELSA
jgi:hypothetical protein